MMAFKRVSKRFGNPLIDRVISNKNSPLCKEKTLWRVWCVKLSHNIWCRPGWVANSGTDHSSFAQCDDDRDAGWHRKTGHSGEGFRVLNGNDYDAA